MTNNGEVNRGVLQSSTELSFTTEQYDIVIKCLVEMAFRERVVNTEHMITMLCHRYIKAGTVHESTEACTSDHNRQIPGFSNCEE